MESRRLNGMSNILTLRQKPRPGIDINDYPTPDWFFKKLQEILNPYLPIGDRIDLCCSEDNRKCEKGLTLKRSFGLNSKLNKQGDSLSHNWSDLAKVGWLASPYNRGLQGKFCKKAVKECEKGMVIVGLVQANVSAIWFQDTITWNCNCVEIHLRGRMQYMGTENNACYSNTVVVWGIKTLPEDVKLEIRNLLTFQYGELKKYEKSNTYRKLRKCA